MPTHSQNTDIYSNYEPPPECTFKDTLQKNPINIGFVANHKEMKNEEPSRNLFETKVNRYPLRQYLNLGAGFEIQFRPNYYESDQEDEEEHARRRRHSIAVPSNVYLEDEAEDECNPNLKVKIQGRRYSEGSPSIKKKENESVKEENFSSQIKELNASKSDGKPGSGRITQTLTYTSKNQIIKLYQTEHLKASQEKVPVYKGLSVNKPSKLKDIVSKFYHKSENEHIDRNESINSKKHASVENQRNVSMQTQYNDIQSKDKNKSSANLKANEETYFLAQLGLKRQSQNEFLQSKLEVLGKKKQGIHTIEKYSTRKHRSQISSNKNTKTKISKKTLPHKEKDRHKGKQTTDIEEIRKKMNVLKKQKLALLGAKSSLKKILCSKSVSKKPPSYRLIEKLRHTNLKNISPRKLEDKPTIEKKSVQFLDVIQDSCYSLSQGAFPGEEKSSSEEENLKLVPCITFSNKIEGKNYSDILTNDNIVATFTRTAVSISNDEPVFENALDPSDSEEITNLPGKGTSAEFSPKVLLEDMFPDESEEDEDFQDLIATLTDSIDTDANPFCSQEVKIGDKCIDHKSHTKIAGSAPLDMTGMEHYKKRLIHQHEKPGVLSSPCTTTEEEDDSLESPLSPASSVQSRESGQQDKKRDEVVQKVARKRAVCRSQFRHQSMELFKLGHSIPTSLCKTKEPYNVCTGKNLQMCYQNGGLKKYDKNISKGSLTESIINTIEGGKRKDLPLWRSVSLNNEISERQNTVPNSNSTYNNSSSSGRHILPAIVPELPDRRTSRIKSMPESSSKSIIDSIELKNNDSHSEGVYEFAEENDNAVAHEAQPVEVLQRNRQNSTEEAHKHNEYSTERRDIVQAHAGSTVRRQSCTSSESDVFDCTPINLSLKNRETVNSQSAWMDLFNVRQPKRVEVNNNQHLTHTIPKQPSNVPKKPLHLLDEDISANNFNQNRARTIIGDNLETNHVDKDGNCFFVTSIPSNALDPQKQSNVIVINFPHIQQQMSRMEKPNIPLPNPAETQQSPMEMLDSPIMSLVNIVKSSVESVFNILSLPLLNRLYRDLNRYLLHSCVSVKMKACIEEALNALISYILINLFRAPRNSKARDFVHKILQLDLQPHMDFLINSLDIIQQKIKYDYFMDQLLRVLSRNPHEDAPMQLRNVRRPVVDFPDVRPTLPPPPPPPPPQYYPNQKQHPEFRDYHNRFWVENRGYQHGNAVIPNADFTSIVSQGQLQRRSRRQHQEADKNLLASTRMRENFNEPNLAMMRPDLYLADNRCIPPNIHSEALLMNPLPHQPRSKGRPRNFNRTSRIPNKLPDNSPDLSNLPQVAKHRAMPEENRTFDHRERVPNSNVLVSGNAVRRNSDIRMRDVLDENVRPRNGPTLALIPNSGTNTMNMFGDNNTRTMTSNHENHKNVNGDNNNLMYPHITTTNNNNVNVSRTVIKNFPEKNFSTNVHVMAASGDEILQHKQQIVQQDVNNKNGTVNKNIPESVRNNGNTVKPGAASDVEQFLQTNVIVNKQTNNVDVPENSVSQINMYNKDAMISNRNEDRCTEEKLVDNNKFHENSEKFQKDSYKTNTFSSKIERSHGNKINEKHQYSESQMPTDEDTKSNDLSLVISSTVIIKDESMEISKDVASCSDGRDSSSTINNTMDLDDVVLERASPSKDRKHGISYRPGPNEGSKINRSAKQTNKEVAGGNYQERLNIAADVSIEKVTREFDMPPKLIKLTSLKRRIAEDGRQQRKKAKKCLKLVETNSSEVVVIEDEEKVKEQEKLDYNQNTVTETAKSVKALEQTGNSIMDHDIPMEKSVIIPSTTSKPQLDVDGKKNPSTVAKQSKTKPHSPIIEDISSEEETLEPFHLYSTYENKIPGDPRKILQTTEVSHCTLIEGNVKAIQNANRHLFEKPPVYTRPVQPRNLRKSPVEDDPANRREPLANMVEFKEDSDTLTCSLKVKNSELNYPSTIDVRRFSPVGMYQVGGENVSPAVSPRFSPSFKSPSRPTRVSPAVGQTSNAGSKAPPLVQTASPLPGHPVPQKSPIIPRSPVLQTSPTVPKSPLVRTSPKLPISRPRISPIIPGPPTLNESDMNWRHWFSEEQRKGVFNFERSQSLESNTLSGRQSVEALSTVSSDYCSKFSPEEPLCEIKIDSKVYRIKKSLFDRIPRGKLCYIRESNTFVRYFDDKQMELFVSNLNLGEGSTVASDLLKQIKGRSEGPTEVETSAGQYESSGKGEVITLSKGVVFSTADFLSDPELYVEEVEKVQRYVPKDFYGFYKFVTGYQIVNHHPPISFQTFLTMHNTNGIRVLFKNYINTLAEGRNVL